MKIGLDLRFYRAGTGGIGRYSRNLLTELLKIDTNNEYTAILTPGDNDQFTQRAPNLKKMVVNIPHFSVAEQRQLGDVLAKEKFDLVHFTNFNHPVLYRGPFVVTIHDMIMHLFPGTVRQNSFIRRVAYKYVFNDCKRAQRIIVPSLSTKKDLTDNLQFPEQKIIVTAEGSENIFHAQSPSTVKQLKQRLALPEKYILFVSRWEKYKGLPALIRAYQKADIAGLGLVICGKPDTQNPEISKFVELAKKKNPLIITPGFVSDEDLVTLYSGAAAYVHPSWYEGFGIMILEAFAAGAPVITSNTSSLPEVVGDAGILIDPNSVSEIAQAITKVVTDPKFADELRQKGFERVKQFSWATMAKQTLAVYEEILKSPPR